MTKKLGLMFGSYNPPHQGHVNTAATAKEEQGLDLVYMIPVAKSPFKTGQLQATFNDKVNMCKILSEMHSSWLSVFDKGASVSGHYIDGFREFKNTVMQVANDNPDSELFIVSGADFRKKLVQAMKVLEVSNHIAKVASNATSFMDVQYITSLADRLENACAVLEKPEIIDLPRSKLVHGEDVSSRKIRNSLENGDKDIGGLPKEIGDYIEDHGLYLH